MQEFKSKSDRSDWELDHEKRVNDEFTQDCLQMRMDLSQSCFVINWPVERVRGMTVWCGRMIWTMSITAIASFSLTYKIIECLFIYRFIDVFRVQFDMARIRERSE